MEQKVIAEWGDREYRATVNSYGVATIAANTGAEHVENVELHRFDDDGGQGHSAHPELVA